MDYYKLKVLNHRKLIIFIILIIIILLVLYYYFYYEKSDHKITITNEEVTSETTISSQNHGKIIYVDIKGCVLKPGVYSFKEEDDARVNDLILKAGGLSKDADTSLLNLSRKLDDEMTIVIYSKNEVNNYVNEQNNLLKKLEICEQKIKNNACISEKKINNDQDKININNASKEDLEKIPGIGDSKAESIINYRDKSPFKNIDEIKNVEGIGDSLFENIKEYLTI